MENPILKYTQFHKKNLPEDVEGKLRAYVGYKPTPTAAIMNLALNNTDKLEDVMERFPINSVVFVRGQVGWGGVRRVPRSSARTWSRVIVSPMQLHP